jgi:hypothetical protein
MNWNDYEAIWKRQELPVGHGADLAVLKETFETKRRKLAATLFARDILEASAGLAVAIAFAFFWWKQGRAGWPIALAIACILWVTGFFITERLRARRNRLGADAPLLAKLEAEIAELRHQQRLLLNVAGWYLAPCLAAILVVLATTVINAPAGALAGHLLIVGGFFGAYLILVGFLFWLIWFVNRRAVRKQIEPRLEELEKLHQSLLT